MKKHRISYSIWILCLVVSVGLTACKEEAQEDSQSEADKTEKCRTANEQIVFPSQMDPNSAGWNRLAPASTFNIWVVDSDGKNLLPVTQNTHGQTSRMPVVYPSGKTISFYSLMEFSGKDSSVINSSANIWVVSRWGEKLRAITRNTLPGLDTFSVYANPSESRLAFNSTTSRDGNWDGASSAAINLWTSNIEMNKRELITNNTIAGFRHSMAGLSPDGNQAAILSSTDLSGQWDGTSHGALNLWLFDLNGKGGKIALTKNTLTGLDTRSAKFFPNGKKIMMLSQTAMSGQWDGTAAPRLNYWTINVDGSGMTAITNFTKNNGLSLDMSPLGNKIAFHSTLPLNGTDGNPLGAANLWTMNVDGTDLVALTQNTRAGFQAVAPRFSPDGTKIAYFSNRDLTGIWDGTKTTSYNLWIVDLKTGIHTALTQNSAAGLDVSTSIIYDWAKQIECKK